MGIPQEKLVYNQRARDEVRIEKCVWNGRAFLDVRIWFDPGDGSVVRTSKGARIPWEEVPRMLSEVLELYQS